MNNLELEPRSDDAEEYPLDGEVLDEEFDVRTRRAWYIQLLMWMWIGTRWTTLMVLDLSLWGIMVATEGAKTVKPTKRISFSQEERRGIAKSQGYKCMYCGRRLTRDNLEIDHKNPVERGGSNHHYNLQALCRRCNGRKGIHTDSEFRERYHEVFENYYDLLDNPMQPPLKSIRQSEFDRITRSTDAHPNVQEFNRNRFQSVRQRLWGAGLVVVIGWTIIIAILGALVVPDAAAFALICGILFGVAFYVGMWMRASNNGILDEE